MITDQEPTPEDQAQLLELMAEKIRSGTVAVEKIEVQLVPDIDSNNQPKQKIRLLGSMIEE